MVIWKSNYTEFNYHVCASLLRTPRVQQRLGRPSTSSGLRTVVLKIPHDITFTQDLMHTEIMGGMCGRGLWPTQEMFEMLGKTLQGFLSHWRRTKCILSRLTKNVSHFCSLSLWYPDIFQAEEFSLEYSSRVSYSVGLCLHERV